MKNPFLHTANRFLIAAVLVSAVASFSFAQEKAAKATSDRVDKVSNKGFPQTVEALEIMLKKNGFMIVATINHQNMLTMVGVRIKGSKTIEFGKPEMGKMLLPMAPEAGLEMPGRFYIWERGDGKTVVSYYRPSAGFNKYGIDMIAKMGRDMDVLWSAMAEEATK